MKLRELTGEEKALRQKQSEFKASIHEELRGKSFDECVEELSKRSRFVTQYQYDQPPEKGTLILVTNDPDPSERHCGAEEKLDDGELAMYRTADEGFRAAIARALLRLEMSLFVNQPQPEKTAPSSLGWPYA